MKKLLISTIAALVMAASSLTLAQGYGSDTAPMDQSGKPSASSMDGSTMRATGTKRVVRVEIVGTVKGKKLAAREITVNSESPEGKPLLLTSNSPAVKVAGERCETTNASTFFKGSPKEVKSLKVFVNPDGKCTKAIFE